MNETATPDKGESTFQEELERFAKMREREEILSSTLYDDLINASDNRFEQLCYELFLDNAHFRAHMIFYKLQYDSVKKENAELHRVIRTLKNNCKDPKK